VSAFPCFLAFWDTEGVNACWTFEIKYSESTKTYSDMGAYWEFYTGGGMREWVWQPSGYV
jgi:hypothetical protein